jgi:hypothetical protein
VGCRWSGSFEKLLDLWCRAAPDKVSGVIAGGISRDGVNRVGLSGSVQK